MSLLFNPIGREMLSTDVYDRKINSGETMSLLPDIQPRKGGRPIVGPHAVPQRQISCIPEADVREVCISFIHSSFLSI